ncbi:MAG: zinc ribbon domain-containing protein [Ruminococcus sp.]
MFCQNCGKELPDNSSFCTSCGAKQDVQNSPVQNEVPAQTTVDSVGQSTGYTVNSDTTPVNNSNQNNNLVVKIAVAAAAVVVLVVGVILVISLISNTGAKGVINRMEDAINDCDAEKSVECYDYSLFLDEDGFDDAVDGVDDAYDSIKDADFDVDFEVKSDKDITEDDCDYDDDMTWQEYLQGRYEDMDEYDDQEVDAVKEVRVRATCDYDDDDEDVEDFADEMKDTKKFYCVKIDGDW